MNLFTKIDKSSITHYRKEFIECLTHNINNSHINSISIFTDEIDHKINLQNVKVYFRKLLPTDLEIFKISKNSSNKIIIISDPFIKFNDLSSINLAELKDNVIENGKFTIFSKDTQIEQRSDKLIFKKQSIQKKLDFISLKIRKVGFEIKSQKNTDTLIKKSSPRQKIKPTMRNKKLDVVIVSVNYNDYLIISLSENIKHFDNITVVTSPEDKVCQNICKKLNVKCVVTDVMYENGASFNKGKAINVGINSIDNPDIILLLDADIIVEKAINISQLSDEVLYTAERYILPNYQSYMNYLINKNKFSKIEHDKGYGFFQLFSMNNSVIQKENVFPDTFTDASYSDLVFRDKFDLKINLTSVLHLGESFLNWKGRVTENFLSNEQFENKLKELNPLTINNLFDNVYCLNLDKRQDRWSKVSYQFSNLDIKVQKWKAIDGSLIEDELYDLYNPDKITGEEASKRGIVENKNALGCLLSHLEIIKDAKKNGYNKILVFEDDVILDKEISFKIKKSLNLEWKILYLGASQFNWKGIEFQNDFYYSKETLGTFAYAMDSSIFDEVIDLLENEKKSVDNLFSIIQNKHYKYCFTYLPNVVISDVSESDIRADKNFKNYSNISKWPIKLIQEKKLTLKVLLVPDTKGWAFDNISKSIIKYNPYPDKISYDTIYVTDIQKGKKINQDEWDYIFVFFEAERCVEPSKKVIRGCYSAFWLENSNFDTKKIGDYFNKCKASVYANETLRDEILPNIKEKQPTIVIPDSSDESIFYPIEGIKEKKFTAIFVGNTERKIKNFDIIKSACEKANVELIVCRNIENSELVNYYNRADVCINFSDFEGGPQTFIESALCEVPMIVRSNLDLSKQIPCFIADTEEELVSTLNKLKKQRFQCKKVGKKARIEALKNFTYKNTSEKFADFFLNIESTKYYYKKDLSDKLTVFIISCGENPNYEDCKNSLENQSVKFKTKEIKNISPMSKAFQTMIDECETEFYIQVDEDMILFEDSIEIIYNSLLKSDKNICTVAHMLKDTHLDFNLYGIKGYKHNILKNYPYNLQIISCEVDQVKRLQNDGYQTLMVSKVLGHHSPKWTNEIIFERYFDLIEKWKNFRYDWLGELPSKLLEIFRNDPSNINLYALMGAMTSLSSTKKIRHREKNFEIKDENFERIKKMSEIKEFKFIKNYDSEESNILTKNLFGEDKKTNES